MSRNDSPQATLGYVEKCHTVNDKVYDFPTPPS